MSNTTPKHPQITPATLAAMRKPVAPIKPPAPPPTNRERARHYWVTEVVDKYKADRDRSQAKADKAKAEGQNDRAVYEAGQAEFFDELAKNAEAGLLARMPKQPVNPPTNGTTGK